MKNKPTWALPGLALAIVALVMTLVGCGDNPHDWDTMSTNGYYGVELVRVRSNLGDVTCALSEVGIDCDWDSSQQ